jgi:hypothetical protein
MLGASALALLSYGSAFGADDLKSGPQPGQNIPGPFNPLHASGPDEGKKLCLVWKNGANPVVMIFAREVSDPLTSLVKKIDEATVKNSDCRMGSFVVFCSDEEGLDKKLKALAEKEQLKKLVLSIDNPSGPPAYKVAKDSDITVVLYTKQKVKVNYTFKKGELKQADIDKIVAEVKEILPEKK